MGRGGDRTLPGVEAPGRPESLPPMEVEPPLGLEQFVQSTQWRRKMHGQQLSASTPVLPSVSKSSRSHPDGAAANTSAGPQPLLGIVSRRGSGQSDMMGKRGTWSQPDLGSMQRRPRGRVSEASKSLRPAARQILAARTAAREVRFKESKPFTDGRRRAALLDGLADLEKEQADPTLGEISKKLMEKGWSTEEVQECLVLLADDPVQFQITSGRELCENRTHLVTQLPDIAQSRGGSLQCDCALSVRNIIQDFRRNHSKSTRRLKDSSFPDLQGSIVLS